MALLHDPETRATLEARLAALAPNAAPRWGKMTADQMLWHVSQAMGVPLGEVQTGPDKPPIPGGILKYLVLYTKWPKNAPTNSAFRATARHDFETERARLMGMIGRLVSKPIDSEWPRHPIFGKMSGKQVMHLQAKHLDYHLTQFGV